MTNISLLLITKNESANLDNWHKWLPKLTNVNELVAVDSDSSDDTVKKLKQLATKKTKVKVYPAKTPDNFASLRTQALKNCSNNWVLWLDADEIPSDEMIDFINNFNFTPFNYSFPRQDYFLGSKLSYGETANQRFVRLFHKKHGKFVGKVHEVWNSFKPTTSTQFKIKHHSHTSFYSFIQKINLYSGLRAIELKEQGIRSSVFSVVTFPIAKFIKDYIFFLGFLDGAPGIIFALGMSFHSFLVRAKLWHLYQTSSH